MKVTSRKFFSLATVLAATMLSNSIDAADCQITTQCVTPPPPPKTTYNAHNNGIISFTADTNGFPMITELAVLGTVLVPFDNVGAGFQMTGRSTLGNAYNPTQAGDCTATPSTLISETTPWNDGANLNLPSSAGFLFTVQPRNYNQPSACAGTGALLPYIFTFGATLGDGVHLPPQVMVIDMSITQQPGSQNLQLAESELPSIYPLASLLPYAYWSPDGNDFYQLTYNGTNNIESWPAGQNVVVNGELVMLCSAGQSICLALFSNTTTGTLISHRQGAQYNLGLLTLVGSTTGAITDYNTHTARKLLVVGTPATISSSITQARATITSWGDLH